MVFFVRIKSRNSLLFFLSSIACAMAMTFSSKVSAKITEVRDPESRRIVMRCNDVTEEVAISDDFADTKIKLIFKDGSEILLDERDYIGSENSPEKFHN